MASSWHSTCDSFFVESAESERDGIYAARKLRQDKARIDAETQMEIADEMSRMVSEEYQEDILDHMEVMEVSSPDNGEGIVSLCALILILQCRQKLCQMLLASTFKQRSSGSCDRTC